MGWPRYENLQFEKWSGRLDSKQAVRGGAQNVTRFAIEVSHDILPRLAAFCNVLRAPAPKIAVLRRSAMLRNDYCSQISDLKSLDARNRRTSLPSHCALEPCWKPP